MNTQGNLISNYKGNKIASCILHTGKVEIFDFNNHTGKLEISDTITFNSNVYCTAFNKNSNRLFIQTLNANRDTSYFYYYENQELVLISKYLHGKIQYMTNFNDVIYIGNMDSMFISTINNLNDSLPVFKSKSINISPSVASVGLNNFNPSNQIINSINFTMDLNCVSNTVQLNGQDTFNATNHDWLIFKQGTTLTAFIKNPLIEFTDTGIYTIQYIASNGSRNDTTSKRITILPEVSANFLGNDTGWCNSIGSAITLSAPSGMHCYEWSTGETNSQITIDTTGMFFTKITTSNFCVLHDTVLITIDFIETFENNFLGEDKIWCKNLDTFVMLSAPVNYKNYLWSTGETTKDITLTGDGQYFVTATKRNQCKNGGNFYAVDTISITLLDAPSKPVLSRVDDSLFINLSDVFTYKWYRNNSLLGDTTEYLILPDTGYYFLKVTKTNGCSNNSDTLYAATLDIKNPLFYQINLYPNPTNGLITIELLSSDKYEFKVKTLTGELLQKGILSKDLNNIDISQYSDGVYFVTIYNNEQSITYKLIKQTE